MLLADDPTPWYNAAWLWGTVAAVIALAALYVGWRAIPARPTILYFWRSDDVQLVRVDRQAQAQAQIELEIRRNGAVLHDPHLVHVMLATKGRADIGPDAFNGPVVLDVGVPITGVLKLESDVEHVPAPLWDIDGSTLRVGPALLARRHGLTFSLLTDGPPTSQLTLSNRPRDVTVRAEPRVYSGPVSRLTIATLVVSTVGAALVFALTVVQLMSS